MGRKQRVSGDIYVDRGSNLLGELMETNVAALNARP